jgi:hypothetical protein
MVAVESAVVLGIGWEGVLGERVGRTLHTLGKVFRSYKGIFAAYSAWLLPSASSGQIQVKMFFHSMPQMS